MVDAESDWLFTSMICGNSCSFKVVLKICVYSDKWHTYFVWHQPQAPEEQFQSSDWAALLVPCWHWQYLTTHLLAHPNMCRGVWSLWSWDFAASCWFPAVIHFPPTCHSLYILTSPILIIHNFKAFWTCKQVSYVKNIPYTVKKKEDIGCSGNSVS